MINSTSYKAIKNDFPAAASVLAVVRQYVGGNAYIAGGAARDIHLNRKPKDWDIFVPCKREDVGGIVDKLNAHWGKGVFRKPAHSYGGSKSAHGYGGDKSAHGYGGRMREEVLSVLKSTCGSVDIVFVDARFGTRAEDVVSKFDSSLALCWLDDLGKVEGLPLFWYSIEARVNIMLPGNCGDGRHFARTAKKLPQFYVVANGEQRHE